MTDTEPSGEPGEMALTVPFTACVSNGGPYDDEAFAAGFDCGAMHTEMLLLRTIGATPAARLVKPGVLDQLDLLAMHNRYTIKRGETDEASGWVWVSFTPDGCGCGTEPSDGRA